MLYKAGKEMAILAYAYEENIDTSSMGSLVGESALLLVAEQGINQGIKAQGILDSRISLIGSKLFEDNRISLVASYRVKPLIGVLSYATFTATNHCDMRCFTGYEITGEGSSDADAIYVYITETGSVYHMTTQCTYLDIATNQVAGSIIEDLRNPSGAKYYACELCQGITANNYYITKYGTRYHTTTQCSALKRTVTAIPITEVGSRHPCSKCGT